MLQRMSCRFTKSEIRECKTNPVKTKGIHKALGVISQRHFCLHRGIN